jgi:uncharacterized protein DUF6867
MHFSIPEFLSEENSLSIFFLVTVLLGGGAAWLTGRAIALTWRPAWSVALYALPLSVAVRFLHFALFDAKFLAPYYYLVDYVVCLGFGYLGFRLMRVRQMVERYKWINQRAGWFHWRQRDVVTSGDVPKSR